MTDDLKETKAHFQKVFDQTKESNDRMQAAASEEEAMGIILVWVKRLKQLQQEMANG